MPSRKIAGQWIEVDSEGFLVDPSQWTPDVADALAHESGIADLTDRHWRVLSFCREDSARRGETPDVERIAEQAGVCLDELRRLFPRDATLAARIAGVHRPRM